MTKLLILLSVVVSSLAYSKCVHEKDLLGSEILNISLEHNVFVSTEGARFVPSSQIRLIKNKKYTVQIFDKSFSVTKSKDPHNEYNRKYVKYYTYARMQNYLKSNKILIESAGYEVRVVGKSIEGRDLFAVTPKAVTNKKTILMLGRHHGDEGTANWIIEGFFNEYLSNKTFRDTYQLILYPMVNPDGTEAHTRYNANGRDLNRSWHKSLLRSYDESKIIHKDLKNFMKKIKDQVFIALDMHGSFSEDFIYRVKKNYVSRDFFNKQQEFIDELGSYDTWQNGNDKKSNGDPAMARLVLINHYKKNAMTHETIRNITKNNNLGRNLQSLQNQGLSLIKTIQNLY